MIHQRIQLSRKRGWKMPPNTVKVCRPGFWGNPYKVAKPGGRREYALAVRQYREMMLVVFALKPKSMITDLLTLRGKNLACWCPLDKPCHADLLLEWANSKALAKYTRKVGKR